MRVRVPPPVLLSNEGSSPLENPRGLKPFPYLPPSSSNTRPGRAPDGVVATLWNCFGSKDMGLEPIVSELTINQLVINRQVPGLRFTQDPVPAPGDLIKTVIPCTLFLFCNAFYIIFALHTDKRIMTSITIRVDEQLKKSFDYMCDQFGLSNSAALNLFMKAVVRERRIPFEIKAESDAEVRQKGWEAFQRMRASAIADGVGEMSLEEINAEIAAARNGE